MESKENRLNEQDYREALRAEFERRRIQKPFYSLRSFAKDLGISFQHLSYLFKGQRGLSKHNALAIARKLGLTHREATRFKFQVSMQSGRSKVERNLAKQWLTKNAHS